MMACVAFEAIHWGGAGSTAEGRLSRRSEMKCFLTARNPLKLAEAAFERVICHAALEETLHNNPRECPGFEDPAFRRVHRRRADGGPC